MIIVSLFESLGLSVEWNWQYVVNSSQFRSQWRSWLSEQRQLIVALAKLLSQQCFSNNLRFVSFLLYLWHSLSRENKRIILNWPGPCLLPWSYWQCAAAIMTSISPGIFPHTVWYLSVYPPDAAATMCSVSDEIFCQITSSAGQQGSYMAIWR